MQGIKRYPLVILFGGWGREGAVIKLCSAGFKIRAVLVPERQSEKLRKSIDRIKARGLRIIICNRKKAETELNKLRGGILLSIGFPYLLSRRIIKKFKHCLNVHPTLLPKYRGPTSFAYVIMNNEKETGSTAHILDSRMDAGPIVLQKKVRLSRFDTINSMRRKVYALEPKLIVDALNLLDDPLFRPVAQDDSIATVFPRSRRPKDSRIDPRQPLIKLYDKIRACDDKEFPAFFYLDGRKVFVFVRAGPSFRQD